MGSLLAHEVFQDNGVPRKEWDSIHLYSPILLLSRMILANNLFYTWWKLVKHGQAEEHATCPTLTKLLQCNTKLHKIL